tara:strand:+ start:1204 stop:1365 length:162 start_codon:yes stop_codon:yes gene_type:complete
MTEISIEKLAAENDRLRVALKWALAHIDPEIYYDDESYPAFEAYEQARAALEQ